MKIKLQIHVYDDPDPFDDGDQDRELMLHQIPGASGLEVFVHVLEGAANLFWQKNQIYGDTWREQGWMGNVARIMSKTARLRNMLWREDPIQSDDESVEDTLLDMVNLAALTLLNRGQENRWGHDRVTD